MNESRTVYITRFKPINHCLVVYHYTSGQNGDIIFDVYDANQPGKLVHLTYRAVGPELLFRQNVVLPRRLGECASTLRLSVVLAMPA